MKESGVKGPWYLNFYKKEYNDDGSYSVTGILPALAIITFVVAFLCVCLWVIIESIKLVIMALPS